MPRNASQILRPLRPPLSLLLLLIASFTGPFGASASLEGRWRLAEQRYGEGSANHADPGAPLRIEFLRQGKALTARVRPGAPAQQTWLVWPAFPSSPAASSPHPATGDAAIPEAPHDDLIVDSVLIDDARGIARTSYRVGSGKQGIVLHVIEDYRLDAQGALAGTVSVRLVDRGEDRGAYLLHRRFEREP